MKLTSKQLRKIILEEVQAAVDAQRFLHGSEKGQPHDDEGYMAKSKLYSLSSMAEEICDLLKSGDQLPGWVQDHLAVAHENLQQIHGYLSGDEALSKNVKESKSLAEGHARITEEEMEAWKKGDWGFVSETKEDPQCGEVPDDYEVCGTCGWDHEYDFPSLTPREMNKARILHQDDEMSESEEMSEGKKKNKGLWANIHARRKAGKRPKRPGEKGYPKTLDIE